MFCLQEKAMESSKRNPAPIFGFTAPSSRFLLNDYFFSLTGTLKICVSSGQTLTRHVETVTTQTGMRLWKNALLGIFGPILVASCPAGHARHPWQEFCPHTSVFWRLQRFEGKLRYLFKGSERTPSKGSSLCTRGRTGLTKGA